LGQKVGDVAAVTDVSVVACQAHLTTGEEVVEAARVSFVAKAE
jgi:hypothetical protein